MANYGPPGPGPQPWHEPQPGEWYGHGRPPDAPPPHDPDQTREFGRPYGDQSHGRAPGQNYGYGQDPGSGQDHGYSRDHGGGQRYGPGESYDSAGHGGGWYGTTDPGHLPQAPDTWERSAHQHDAETGYAGTPAPPPPRRRGRMLVVLAAGLVLMLGGATAFYLLGRDGEAPTPVAAPTEEGAPAPDAQDDETTPDDPAAASSATPLRAGGQCVRNDSGAGGKPRLLLSECAPRSYEVLRRIDGKTSGERDAEEKCAAVDGYTNWYFYDSELDSLDFVLCLKQRG